MENVYIDANNHLIVVLSNGKKIDAGEANTSQPGTSEPGTTETVKYTIVFKDFDGKELKRESVESGKNATPPANPIRNGYIFNGWSGKYTNVTANADIIAPSMTGGSAASWSFTIGDDETLVINGENGSLPTFKPGSIPLSNPEEVKIVTDI